MSKKALFWNLCFIFVIIFSIFTIIYSLSYTILIRHDLVFPYDRTFFQPEHGRYIATFVTNLLIEKLPEILNIHPNDFLIMVVNPIKAVLIVISFLFIANTFFLFKKENYNLLKFPADNPSFILTYILIFVVLYNNNFFFNDIQLFYEVFENMVFFEYPMSIVVYVIVSCMSLYLFMKQEKIGKFNYAVLIIMTFFLALTVEPINLPVFAAYAIMALYAVYVLIKKHLKKENISELKQKYLYVLPFYITYIAGLICYYIKPSNHDPFYNNLSFIEYVKDGAVTFIKDYFRNFIAHDSIMLLPIIISIMVCLFLCNKEDAKKLIFFVAVNIIAFHIFFISTFLIGYSNDQKFFWLAYEKWLCLYKVITLFYFIVIVGFICDKGIFSRLSNIWKKIVDFICDEGNFNKYSNIIKILICLIVFTIFHHNLITGYWYNLEKERIDSKLMRTYSYQAEKAATVSDNKNLILPVEFESYKDDFWFDNIEYENCDYTVYINNVHPKVKKENIIYSENAFDNISFTDKELKELKFQNLLTERMYRHKKGIVNCY